MSCHKYECFGKYKEMVDEGFSKDTIIQEIEFILSQNNVTLLSLMEFGTNEYTKANINSYIYVMDFLNFDRIHFFIKYIVKEYFFKRLDLLDVIYNPSLFECFINEQCNCIKNGLNDEILLYLSKYITITTLNASNNESITDKSVASLICITTLNASGNERITDKSVSSLICITNLNASNNESITDKSVASLICITTLNASFNLCITDMGIIGLQNIIALNASFSTNITDKSILKLPHLTMLDASYNKHITDMSILKIHNLVLLNGYCNDNITEEAISKLRLYMLGPFWHETETDINYKALGL